MKKRNIALCIIFSIITFGIYGLYWFVHITNDVNTLANPEKKTSGGVALLLTIITCNIYGIYWAYKMGGLLDKAQTDRGNPAQNRAVVFCIRIQPTGAMTSSKIRYTTARFCAGLPLSVCALSSSPPILYAQ